MSYIPELFASNVFDAHVMKERLPKDIYERVMNTVESGAALDIEVANVVASVMKDWAIEKGATHFTHWFQPLTGITAEKHDSFLSPDGNGGIIMEFSGKELVKGEPDASSFPSGGLRATFEARGYTAWDPTSYAFIKGNTLCIPTAFCSYGGHALDKKTPLLRSMQALEKQAMRILRLFGNEDVKRVQTTVGAEQEYFLIDRELFKKRPDLIYSGRTLFGAMPPKGQEMDDHYFGAIKPHIAQFMAELDEELWKLGIYAKTEHNEVAPSQHELAPVFTTTNVATDQNQLTMESMTRIAQKHGMECLLHEKPFDGVNGSGKHNNWSMSTDTGKNLLEPGETPSQNVQFLLFLVAVLRAVDDYQELIRVSVASAGNDHRLGANEAPPAIVSVFLGDELTAVLDAIENGSLYRDRAKKYMDIGATVLPPFPKDSTDRNRTSPFAFTGNKFELRMLGSSASIAGPNVVLNTIVASVLEEFADRLENNKNFDKDVITLIRETYAAHKRIVFNGNGYDDAWVKEAKKRGLANLVTTVDAIPEYISKKSLAVFKKYGVYSKEELKARYDVKLGSYYKRINIEALTMVEMVKRGYTGAVVDFEKDLTAMLVQKQSLGMDVKDNFEKRLLEKVSTLSNELAKRTDALDALLPKIGTYKQAFDAAKYCKDKVLPAMNDLREVVDELETMVPGKYWPFPTYGELLYSVQ